MNKSGKIWPYAIVFSIVLIFIACVVTIIVATKLPVQKSDTYMMDYHEADANANDILKAAIDFNKKYKIEYLGGDLGAQNCVIKYKITDINLNPIEDAEIIIVITRPNSREYDIELSNPVVEEGIYTFETSKLPKDGRWDIMAKVKIDNAQRFYNIKADTRVKDIIEY